MSRVLVAESLRAHFERDHMSSERTIRGRVGAVAWLSARDEYFDLADALAQRGIEPCGFCFGRCHSRELSHGGPGEGAVLEPGIERRQRFERSRDSQFLVERTWLVSE